MKVFFERHIPNLLTKVFKYLVLFIYCRIYLHNKKLITLFEFGGKACQQDIHIHIIMS